MYTLYDLQQYWWLLVSIIGGFFVFMMFVQGGQTLLNTLAKTQDEKDLIINSLGRKWEIGFSSLIMFGGALFAAFPLFYSVSFGGAYYVWMSILFCFIIQAVSYEYRKKPNNVYGEVFYERLLFINGSLGIFLIGVALGTLYTGGNFEVNDMNLSHWTNSSYGLEALLNPFNLLFGLILVLLSRIQAMLYFFNSLDNDNIKQRIISRLKIEFLLFLPIFLIWMLMLFTNDGYSYDEKSLIVFVEPYKMLHNLIEVPTLFANIIIGVIIFLFSIFNTIVLKKENSIWFLGFSTVLLVTSILMLLGVNNTIIYPSLSDLQSSLSIKNSSGSLYTLEVMSIVSLLVPVVIGYIVIVWRSMDKEQLSIDEVKSDPHHY